MFLIIFSLEKESMISYELREPGGFPYDPSSLRAPFGEGKPYHFVGRIYKTNLLLC